MYAKTQIIVIAGSPGSGKTSLVDRYKKTGDMIWDMDKIIETLTGLPLYVKPDGIVSVAIAMREVALKELISFNQLKRAWFILSVPKKWQREELRDKYKAKIYVLETPQKECIERIEKDSRRNLQLGMWIEIVKHWWRDYEPDDRDIVIKYDEISKIII